MFSRFFIERPIFAAVVAIIICLAGLVSMAVLPVAAVPDDHAGAGHGVGDLSGRRLEDARRLGRARRSKQQINGVDNMLYMSSTSSVDRPAHADGLLLARHRIPTSRRCRCRTASTSRCRSCRPPSCSTGVNVQKKSSSIMMLVGGVREGRPLQRRTTSPITPTSDVLDALEARATAPARRRSWASPNQAMRIWMNPDRMASLGITTTDIANAVSQQNAALRRRADRPAAEPRARSSSRSRSSRRPQFTDPQAVREHHPAREPGRQRDRARRRRRARRDRPAAVHRRQRS